MTNLNRPFFSVLLPTYNRASILPMAIESVMGQTERDFELIISNGGSTDETAQVVGKFSDERIRYFESAGRLSMAENYENTLDKASGEYIIFFSDDDAFVPSMLRRVRSVVEEKRSQMLVFPFAHYHHDENPASGIGANSLEVAPFSGVVRTVKSIDDVRKMSGWWGLSEQPAKWEPITPLIGNVAFHRSILEKLRERRLSPFATIPVDTYFITLVLGLIDEYHVIDYPLLVWSKWSQNASSSMMKDLRKHYETLLAGKSLEQVPLKFALPMNCAANALLQANRDIGGTPELVVDWQWYFLKISEYLAYLDAEGIDTSEETREFQAVLANQPQAVRTAVEKATTNGTFFMTRQQFKRNHPSAVKLMRRLRGAASRIGGRAKDSSEGSVLEGRRCGFSNLLEAAAYLDSSLPKSK